MGKQARLRKERIEAEEKSFKDQLRNRKKTPWYDLSRYYSNPATYLVILAVLAIIAFPFYKNYQDNRKEYALLKTSDGDIKIELFKKDAPNTVANIEKLARSGFYKHLTWHRVIKEFVIQTGDPKGDGTGGPGYQFNDEINSHKFTQGTVGMANSGVNTNGSQFFIVTQSDQTSLDGKYTAFGQVVEGMDAVTKISESPTDSNDMPIVPVYLEDIQITRK
jgi:cyclophilin family peptidyl-prolyl cis-trans isomerase